MLKKLYLCSAVLWSAIITFLCLVQLQNVPFKGVSNIDKLVHTFFYFVLTILWFLYFSLQLDKDKYSKHLLVSVIFSFFYGVTIEIFQECFTTSRHADLYDVFANLFGTLLAFFFLFCWCKYFKFRIKK